ncbi:hypothetical protein SCALM49S_10237 [Streptomyces californicus]
MLARLGVRPPGDTRGLDLHRGNFDVDKEAITVGVELFTAAALLDANRRRIVDAVFAGRSGPARPLLYTTIR